MSHRHHCCVTGHDFECGENCECICGLPMEGNDHSDCPVELRPCPKHKDKTERRAAEVAPDAVEIDFSILSPERQRSKADCQCGCANIDPGTVVGWCLWCGHGYVEYSPKNENRHFAHHCPNTPAKLKNAALARWAKRRAK